MLIPDMQRGAKAMLCASSPLSPYTAQVSKFYQVASRVIKGWGTRATSVLHEFLSSSHWRALVNWTESQTQQPAPGARLEGIWKGAGARSGAGTPPAAGGRRARSPSPRRRRRGPKPLPVGADARAADAHRRPTAAGAGRAGASEGRAGGWPRPLAALNMDRGLALGAQPPPRPPSPSPGPLAGSRGAPGRAPPLQR